MRFFRWLALGLVLLMAGVLYVGIRSYRVFIQEELVAVVRCEPAPAGASYSFLLQITFMENNQPGSSEKFPMVGDQWAVGGDFLKWSPGLALFGLKSRQKLTRLNSRYWSAADELSKPRTAYDLQGGTSLPWRWLHRVGVRLPGVDALYGSTVYVPFQAGGAWGIHAAHSGYLARPWKEKG